MSYFKAVIGLGVTVAIILLVGQFLVDKTNSYFVSSCREINKSGAYILTSYLRGAPMPVQPIMETDTTACISIKSDDVLLDCLNHSIVDDIYGNLTVGILVSNVTNVTIRNCMVGNYWSGVYYIGSSGGNVSNNILLGNIHDGVGLLETNRTLVDNNMISFSADNAIGISHGWNDIIRNNMVLQSNQVVDCSPCYDSQVYNNTGRAVGMLLYDEGASGLEAWNNTVVE